MTNTANGSTSSGVGFSGMLTLLFIGLKLGHVINWSWVWVLTPMWIGLALALLILFVALIVMAVKR